LYSEQVEAKWGMMADIKFHTLQTVLDGLGGEQAGGITDLLLKNGLQDFLKNAKM